MNKMERFRVEIEFIFEGTRNLNSIDVWADNESHAKEKAIKKHNIEYRGKKARGESVRSVKKLVKMWIVKE